MRSAVDREERAMTRSRKSLRREWYVSNEGIAAIKAFAIANDTYETACLAYYDSCGAWMNEHDRSRDVWRKSPEGIAAHQAFIAARDAYQAACAAFDDALDACMD